MENSMGLVSFVWALIWSHHTDILVGLATLLHWFPTKTAAYKIGEKLDDFKNLNK